MKLNSENIITWKKVSLRVQREQSDWNHDLIYSRILHKKNQTFENTEEYYARALRVALMARVKWMEGKMALTTLRALPVMTWDEEE